MRLQTHVCSVFPTLTVAVGGELDMESGPCLRDQLTCMIRAIGPRLALDLTGVTFIDCSGLTALLTARKAAQARGGWLRLVAVSRCVGRLVRITGLQDALRDTPSPAPRRASGGRPRQPGSPGHLITKMQASMRSGVGRSAPPGGRSLWDQVVSGARCTRTVLDPDAWFPVSPTPEVARREAATAIATCMACPVRAQCLELSLRHWDIGQHGVWGGLIPADRAELRRRLPGRKGLSEGGLR